MEAARQVAPHLTAAAIPCRVVAFLGVDSPLTTAMGAGLSLGADDVAAAESYFRAHGRTCVVFDLATWAMADAIGYPQPQERHESPCPRSRRRLACSPEARHRFEFRRVVLKLVPVYSDHYQNVADYRTLSEAIALGEVLVTEQSMATVNALRVVNKGVLPVLILDGEEVVGGLQNRVVNTTLLIPAESAFDLPVSCFEHGFHAGEAVHPTLRREKSAQVTASLHTAEAPLANQQAIWSEVDARHRAMGTSSATAALRDAYVQRGNDLDHVLSGLAYPSDGPVGVVALFEGRAQCADLFDRPETLRVYWNRLVRSYALEALDRKPGKPSVDSAAWLLRRPGRARLTPFASIGIGTDVRIVGNGVVGAARVHGQKVVHTGIFRHRERGHGADLQGPRERARRLVRREQF